MRVTFDHDQRFVAAEELFPSRARSRPNRPRVVVLEIKARERRSRWLEKLVRRYELKSPPDSKYARSVEQTRPSFFTSSSAWG